MTGLSVKYIEKRIKIFVSVLVAECVLMIAAVFVFVGDTSSHWAAFGGAAVLSVTLFFGYRLIYKPYLNNKKLVGLFLKGYTLDGVSHLENPVNEQSELLLKKVAEMTSTDEYINSSRRHAQYLALQNQINPHFLYNTLEGIRGEALAAGLDNVAEMTEALATFFRYTVSNHEKFVSVESELGNIENYFIIQRFRFGDRLSMKLEYDEDDWLAVKNTRLPRLTLQPVVENSIVHGIERKVGQGVLKIRFELTEKRLIITISDDGAGMDEQTLSELNAKLRIRDVNYIKSDGKGGGIALVNVNNRLKLLFGEEYGIKVNSTKGLGTDVELTVPRVYGG